MSSRLDLMNEAYDHAKKLTVEADAALNVLARYRKDYFTHKIYDGLGMRTQYSIRHDYFYINYRGEDYKTLVQVTEVSFDESSFNRSEVWVTCRWKTKSNKWAKGNISMGIKEFSCSISDWAGTTEPGVRKK